jgi:hypothetical protein
MDYYDIVSVHFVHTSILMTSTKSTWILWFSFLTQLYWKIESVFFRYISSLDIHWIEFSIDFWKLVKNQKNAGGECVKNLINYTSVVTVCWVSTGIKLLRKSHRKQPWNMVPDQALQVLWLLVEGPTCRYKRCIVLLSPWHLLQYNLFCS